MNIIELAQEELAKPDPNPFYLAMLGIYKEKRISLEEAHTLYSIE